MIRTTMLFLAVAVILSGCTANGDGSARGTGDGDGTPLCQLRDPVTGICVIGGLGCLLRDPATGVCILGGPGCLLRDPVSGVCLVGGEGCLVRDPISGECVAGADDCLLLNPVTGACTVGGPDCLLRDPITDACIVGGDDCLLTDPVTGECTVGTPDCTVTDPVTGECITGGPDCQITDPVTGECVVGGSDCELRDPATGECVVGSPDCELRDPVTGACIIDDGGDELGNLTCTNTPGTGAILSVVESGPLCALTDPLNPLLDTCGASDPLLVVDQNFDTASTVQFVASGADPLLGGSVSLVLSLPAVVNAGQVASFLVEFPGGLVDASLLRSLTVATALGGTPAESAGSTSVLSLDVLGLGGGSGRFLVGFINQQPYDQLTLTIDSSLLMVDVMDAVNVHEACVNAMPTL